MCLDNAFGRWGVRVPEVTELKSEATPPMRAVRESRAFCPETTERRVTATGRMAKRMLIVEGVLLFVVGKGDGCCEVGCFVLFEELVGD